MRVLTIIVGELVKMFRQRGTYAGYILLAALIGMFAWGIWAEGPSAASLDRQFGDDMVVGGNTISGAVVSYMLLRVPVAVNVFIPLLVSMIAGGLIAGEAQRGTLRAMMVRPIHRWAAVLAKACAAFIHSTSLVLFMGVLSLLVGYIVFGGGDLVAVEGGLRIFTEWDGIRRLALAYGITALTMCSVAALALFCSTIFEHPLTASGVTVGFLIVSGALMLIPSFEWLRPHLLTTHLNAFKHVFERDIVWAEVRYDLIYVLYYTLAAVGGTLLVFQRKDITC